MSARLQGEVCVVTGAASGIGKALVAAMRDEGAIVVGLDLALAAEPEGPWVRADVSNEDDVTGAIASIIRDYERIDVLVNNAGIWGPGTVATTGVVEWDHIFAVNVRGVYLASRAVVPHMQERGKGSIVNVASNYGLVGGVNCAAYTASKGAVVALTKAMALDHAAEGIRVNCVCPGTIDTPLVREPMKSMTRDQLAVQQASRVARHPVGRIGLPSEIAPGVIYLASGSEASFVTGAILSIDGGYVAR